MNKYPTYLGAFILIFGSFRVIASYSFTVTIIEGLTNTAALGLPMDSH